MGRLRFRAVTGLLIVLLAATAAAQRGGAPSTPRPHGDHNPRHGGQFFMAPDNWHHLEGTYPRARLFRLYVYDDYSRPLAAADLRRVQARVVTRETFDPATKKTTELAVFPLRASRQGAYLEARVDPLAMPAALTAKVRVKPDAPEYRFDFTFPAFTKEPAFAKTTAGQRVGRAAAESTIPEITIPQIIEQLRTRDEQIRDLIRAGNFSAVWVPAFQARDLAIALEPHAGHLAPRARESAEPAIQRVVRYAWLLDAFGDAGNRQQIETAYAAFAAAVAEVVTAFAGAR